ncbi:DUF485 domain-containing protein [Amycolatopsis cynarae]|uniref:DUF485 domain-containing protein n=1 Tax=Amycolatopsis cynarae TaxID=2995223 RepID=A0ABY7B8Q1_9PSEU|nr:DUF485 domain-containing protein [Amycolatopsis sp. HUAS 11-8]WAL67543.1 DUF485 domain-containing protein [Amycolatopsis sp. HUAS 11-8]
MPYVAQTTATGNARESGGKPALFEAGDSDTTALRKPRGHDYVAIQRSEEFTRLRSRFRRFVFPMSALFFAWYLVFVLLAAYAHDFMSIKVYGEVNVGMVMGLLQFVSTVAICTGYLRWAKKHIDPQVAHVREQAGVR